MWSQRTRRSPVRQQDSQGGKCVHYDGPNKPRVIPEFDQWNYISMELLAIEKKGQVSNEGDFIRFAEENWTQSS